MADHKPDPEPPPDESHRSGDPREMFTDCQDQISALKAEAEKAMAAHVVEVFFDEWLPAQVRQVLRSLKSLLQSRRRRIEQIFRHLEEESGGSISAESLKSYLIAADPRIVARDLQAVADPTQVIQAYRGITERFSRCVSPNDLVKRYMLSEESLDVLIRASVAPLEPVYRELQEYSETAKEVMDSLKQSGGSVGFAAGAAVASSLLLGPAGGIGAGSPHSL